MQIFLIVLGVLVAVILLLNVYARLQMKKMPEVPNHERILILTDSNFQHQTKNKIVLVDFWAEWCAPCRMMAPVLNEVAAELKADAFVAKVDVEQNQVLANKFAVRSIPTLILFKDGKEIKRFVGLKSRDFLLNEIQKN